MAKKLFTSESVTEGHPDKVCDQISDAVLDAIIAQDPQAHVACEVTATTGCVHVMGEISTECYVDINSIVRNVVNEIGYDNPGTGFNGNTCAVYAKDVIAAIYARFKHFIDGRSRFSCICRGDVRRILGRTARCGKHERAKQDRRNRG